MDEFDYKILECLKSDARMSYQRVSEKVGLSISSVGAEFTLWKQKM